MWGKYVGIYEGYSNNPAVRYAASSGGILTSLAVYFLEEHIVDGVIHTGADDDYPLSTKTYVSRTADDVMKHMGSRYSIFSPLMNIMDILSENLDKKYLFIGKPCDVMALKRGMAVNEQLKKQIVFTMSFFCAGIPSDEINSKLLNEMGCPKEELHSFTYRGNGWPGYTTATDKSGHEYKMTYQEAWMEYLGRNVKKICRYCMDGIGEAADVACADLWYLDKNNKPDFSEHEGRNLILARNNTADSYIQKAAEKGYITVGDYSASIQNLPQQQPHQFSRRVTMRYRILPLRLFGKFAPKYSSKLLKSANAYSSKGVNWSTFKGSVKRILQGKV